MAARLPVHSMKLKNNSTLAKQCLSQMYLWPGKVGQMDQNNKNIEGGGAIIITEGLFFREWKDRDCSLCSIFIFLRNYLTCAKHNTT